MRTNTFNGQEFGTVGFSRGLRLGLVTEGAIVEISKANKFGKILEVVSSSSSEDGFDVCKILKCQDVETGEIFEAEYNNDLLADVKGYEVTSLWLPLEQAIEYAI